MTMDEPSPADQRKYRLTHTPLDVTTLVDGRAKIRVAIAYGH